jgi:hypothetical protein
MRVQIGIEIHSNLVAIQPNGSLTPDAIQYHQAIREAREDCAGTIATEAHGSDGRARDSVVGIVHDTFIERLKLTYFI